MNIFSKSPEKKTRPVWGLFVAVAALFLGHVYSFYPFISDNAFIALRYSKRLIQGLGLTWNEGERIEGYTDFLWMIVNAGVGTLGVDLVVSARVLGTIGGLAALFFVSLSPKRFRLESRRIVTAALFLALSSPLAIWAVGGRDQGFMAGLLAAGLFFLFRALQNERPRMGALVTSSILFAFLAITRTDAFVLVGAVGLGLLIHLGFRRNSLVILFAFAALPMLFVAGHLIFRYIYYGELLPSSATAKVSFSSRQIFAGLGYVSSGLRVLAIPIAAAAMSLVVAFRRIHRLRWLVPVVLVFGCCVYLVVVSNDTFYAWRRLLVVFVAIAFLISEGVARMRPLDASHRLASTAVIVLLGAMYTVIHLTEPHCTDIREREHRAWNGLSFGEMLKSAFKESQQKPLIAMDAAGSLSYFSELPALDMLGLDDGRYVMRRPPDIIVFNQGNGEPVSASPFGKALLGMPAFRDAYQLARFRGKQGNRALTFAWMVKDGGPVGMTRTQNKLEVPSYFLSNDGDNVTLQDREDRLYLPIDNGRMGRIDNLTLGAGTWRIETRPPLPHVPKTIECRTGTLERADMDPDILRRAPVVTVSEDAAIGVTVGPGEMPPGQYQPLRALVLTRVDAIHANMACRGGE